MQAELNEARQLLKKYQEEYAKLIKRREQLDKERVKVNNRLQMLVNPWSRRGAIRDAERRVQLAELRIKSENLRKVEWCKSGFRQREFEYVVTRVTPKRIYIRRKNQERETFYQRETGKTSWNEDGQIDIERTFPEGIDEFAKRQKGQKQ